ncbi:hypothetical protein [Janthinobacterium fluminis]|uniref:Uncharacterized protein n=1 Tax=Janthinobacterium fluminis TaxID=2987524 RepID=A0ABT5K763_9BURK|nr:hypothetical protein [Janthinobacterium fluminis]MDC8760846.1 hypothetical protein [Janthinobacterium fluminis]
MLNAFILAGSFVGYVLSFASLAHSKISEAVLAVLALIGLLLYYGSIAGFLPETATSLLWGGLIVLLLWIPRLKTYSFESRDLIFAGCAALGLIGFSLKWYGQYQFLGWDEFSHWGLIAKYLNNENRLFTADSVIMFKAYPPGTALLQYYFSRALGNTESAILFAQMALFFSALVAATSAISKKPLLAITAMIVCLIGTYILGYEVYEIYVDAILGVLLGSIFAVLLTNTAPRRGFFFLIPVLAFLPLVKHVGFAFAVIGIGAMTVALLHEKITTKDNRDGIRLGAACLGAAIMAVLISYYTWKNYYINLGVAEPYVSVMTFDNVIKFFFNPTSERHVAVWAEFAKRVLAITPGKDLSVATPFLSAITLTVLSVVHIWLLPSHARVRQSLIFGLIAAGLVAYTCLLLLSYGFYFSDYEAVRLASFERYFASYQLAWVMALACAAIQQFAAQKRNLILVVLVVASVFYAFMAIPKVHADIFLPEAQRTSKYVAQLRDIVRSLSDEIRPRAHASEKTYFIHQQTSGLTYFMFRYEMAPLTVNSKCWSLGARYTPDDIYTCDIALDEALKGYDFFAIAIADAAFWARYGSWFAEEDRGISPASFAVIRRDGNLYLKRLKKNEQ